jgi:Peptidase family M28/PDZ domain
MIVRKRAAQIALAFGLLIYSCSTPKQAARTDEEIRSNLKEHISTLASDDYEGRETGTHGEELATNYLVERFKEVGLKAKGTKGYVQEFEFTEGATMGAGNQLYVNLHKFNINDDFYPLPYSSNGTYTGYIVKAGYGIYAPTLNHDDYKGKINLDKKIFVLDAGSPDGNDPHGKFGDYDIRQRVQYAVSRGARAVIFIQRDTSYPAPVADFNHRITPGSVPVIFAKGKAAMLLLDSVVTNCTIGTEVQRTMKKGHNVIGFLDNGAATTVVIGAHYDHLGYGGESSLFRGEKAIHNGADDNASGSAALIELAGQLRNSPDKKNNYLFIAFSGEEKGLLGSNYFVKHPTVDMKKVNYMMNMDMVGRLKPDEKTLLVLGSGTSPSWKMALDTVMHGLKIKTTESGVGPSDHTSFYLDSIPVLHFFTGTHSDYHKPSDDEPLINYEGEVSVMHVMLTIIHKLNDTPKLVFSKTKDDSNSDTPRFKVTLGVIPDYAFDGEGMRIDGVTDGKPASKAGLLKGDVVIQLGEHQVTDMMSYMKALGKFSKGETTKVKVKRGTETVEKDITF